MKLRLLTLVLLVLCGCRGTPGPPCPEPEPFPDYAVPDMVGTAVAGLARDTGRLPAGPGADGREGDILMENALSQFVIGGAARRRPMGRAGHVLDATPQGGLDRMRLMALCAGEGRWPVIYRAVAVVEPGGEGVAAEVCAEGHVAGLPAVRIATRYRLPPDSESLEVVSTVRNTGARTLAGFALHELVCPGRSFRYSPQQGQFPRGRSPGGPYLAFYVPDAAWGVMPGSRRSFQSEWHGSGRSLLTYGASDLAPGASRSCSRRLMATGQGPGRVWCEALGLYTPENVSHLEFKLAEEHLRAGVPWFEVFARPLDGGPSALMLSRRTGVAQITVPSGRYELEARCPGYGPWSPVDLACAPQMTYQFPVRLRPPHVVYVDVRGATDAAGRGSPARIVDHRLEDDRPEPVRAPPFPVWPARGVQLATGTTTVPVPLSPEGRLVLTEHEVTVSRGPLYDVLSARVKARAGEERNLQAELSRCIDPGRYAAVDFRQYDDRSLDCPLTGKERLAANACEGLDAAVVAAPPGSRLPPYGPGAVQALRLDLPGAGQFTLWPVQQELAGDALLPAQEGPGLLRRLRRTHRGARLTVHRPFQPGRGALALAGWTSPEEEPPEDLRVEFDAMELLGGREVERARAMLPAWFALLNRGHRIMAVGGSGSRGILGDEAGVARTFVRLPEDAPNASEGLQRMAAGRWQGVPDAFVTNGPFVTASLNGRPPGSVQHCGVGEVELSVRIQAAPPVAVDRLTVYRNGMVVERREVGRDDRTVRLDRTFELGVFGDCWFCVVVEGDRPMAALYGPDAPEPFAVTNPMWVDADGDGQVQVSQF